MTLDFLPTRRIRVIRLPRGAIEGTEIAGCRTAPRTRGQVLQNCSSGDASLAGPELIFGCHACKIRLNTHNQFLDANRAISYDICTFATLMHIIPSAPHPRGISVTEGESVKASPISVCIRLLVILGVLLLCGNYSPAQQVQEIFEVKHDESPALRDIPPAPQIAGTRNERENPRLPHPPGPNQIDTVVQSSPFAPLALAAPSPGLNFDGVGIGFGSYVVCCAPPDTNGSVGPNHYVQLVNLDLAVFNKSGALLHGPVPINTIWSLFGGGCQNNNDGDPIVLYDKIADRWLISQFSVTTIPYLQCVAISTTPDPTGSYYRYAFNYGNNFPDYPKVGVWPDAYYSTFNMFNSAGTAFLGADVCAWDRSKMLVGAAATQQCFQLSPTWGGLLPSDFDGTTPPPSGSPNYLVGLDAPAASTLLQYWKFHVDWTTPANTTFTGPTALTVVGYTNSCSTLARGDCIPQGGGGTNLESLADRIMYRFAYRNLGDHEALVVNHTIEVGSGTSLHAGVRWYELRPDASHNLSVFQQSTYAPDADWRWMGSAAMDKSGNIAMGYSVSSSSLFPQIHFTGRLAGDPAGSISQGENIIINGTGAQNGGLARWGDYSSMSVDPVDDCTFWYTNEYLKASGSFNWSTRIASFKFPNCTPPVPDYSLSATPSSRSVVQGAGTSYTVTVTPSGGFTATVTFSVSGLPAGAAATFNPTSVAGSGSSTMSVHTATTTPTRSYPLTITGTSGTLTHTTPVTLVVTAAPTPDFSLSTTPSSVTVTAGSPARYTEKTHRAGGFTGSVSLKISGLPAGAAGTFSPNPATGATSALTVATSSTTPAGSYVFTVTGTSTNPALTRTSTATLVVTAPTAGNFSLSPTPASRSIPVGARTTYTINITRTGGFTGGVTLSAAGVPADATATFSPNPATGASSTLTVATSGTTPVKTFTITITGTSGTRSHTTNVSLTVTSAPCNGNWNN